MNTNILLANSTNIPMGIISVVIITEFFKKIPLINKIKSDYIQILVAILYIVATQDILNLSVNGALMILFSIALLTFASGILYDLTLNKLKTKIEKTVEGGIDTIVGDTSVGDVVETVEKIIPDETTKEVIENIESVVSLVGDKVNTRD